jgi:Major Facilitator Superfamily.
MGVIRRDRLLVVVFTVFGAVVLFAAMDNVAEVFFAKDTLGTDGWGYGLLASVWILGIVIGASTIARRLSKDRLVPALLFASIVGGLAVGIAAVFPALGLALVMFGVGGVANGVQSVSMRSLVVHRVGDSHRGRAFAAYGGIANGMQLVAMALGGGLVMNLGGRATLVVGAAGCFVAGLVGIVWFGSLPASIRAMPELAEGSSGSELTVEVPDTGPLVRLPDSQPAPGTNADI